MIDDQEFANIEVRLAALARAATFLKEHVPDAMLNARGYAENSKPYDADARLRRLTLLAEWLMGTPASERPLPAVIDDFDLP